MTITVNVLLLLMVLFAVKHKGADAPQMFLGVMLGVAAASGSIVEQVGLMGIDLVNQVVNAVSNMLGQGNVV